MQLQLSANITLSQRILQTAAGGISLEYTTTDRFVAAAGILITLDAVCGDVDGLVVDLLRPAGYWQTNIKKWGLYHKAALN